LGNGHKDKASLTDGATFHAGFEYGIELNRKGFINLTGEYSLRNQPTEQALIPGRSILL
jgi:hypothetical protein